MASASSLIMNTANADFTLQSYVTELNGVSALLEQVIGIRVLAALVWDYSGLDGRQRVNYFLDRKLSPSPSFVLSYDPTTGSYRKLFQFAVSIDEDQTQLLDIMDEKEKKTFIVKVNGRTIVEEKYDAGALFSSERTAKEAIQILRHHEECSKLFLMQNLQYFSFLENVPELSDDLINSGLSTKQCKKIIDSKRARFRSNYYEILLFKILSCQKPFNLQFVMQNKVEEVICHLKLNGLPLHGTSDPGKGRTEEEAIDDVLTKSSQYLLKMTNTLTHREFRIIETELVRRYVLDNPMNAQHIAT